MHRQFSPITMDPVAGMPSHEEQAFEISLRDFVRSQLKQYDGEPDFLRGPSERTKKLWAKCQELLAAERASTRGVLAVDSSTVASITAFTPGYIDPELELVVGLQTDLPLKRATKPFGGIKVVEKALDELGQELDPAVRHIFTTYRKTHNQAVFDVYTPRMKLLRKAGILTGLPDAYARGRIIGEYGRVAVHGVDALIRAKQRDLEALDEDMLEEEIRLREELTEQIRALDDLKTMASSYGFDISRPAANARQAVQWTYFAYLGAVKEQDGAAMSLGNLSGLLDIFIERDIAAGKLNEEEAQELIDQLVIKLRLIRHLRTAEYDSLFAGEPTWVTESIAGMWRDGKHRVCKTSYRMLQTLYNIGPAPEPNLTVLWSEQLPESFKQYCARVSLETSAIQYENDDLMRTTSGNDYNVISCCVSRLASGSEMQYFGARCNIAKALLYALNSGRDELTGQVVVPGIEPVPEGLLEFEGVMERYQRVLSFLAREYVKTMNVIHWAHDKYYYERLQMALLDTHPQRLMAFGIAGLSVAADSLSAIKHGRVCPVRDERGIAVGFEVEGAFPNYGNDDDRADSLAQDIVNFFDQELSRQQVYRKAMPTLSVLTITSNVMYGKKTGATPDGRAAGEPFAPGANPMHGRDASGAVASLNSVAKLDYRHAQDGISNTFSVTPATLGVTTDERAVNLVSLLEGYFAKEAHHLNVNVLTGEVLIDAMEHPEKYPELTVRVSGYAVNFLKLSREHQLEVIRRTRHENI